VGLHVTMAVDERVDALNPLRCCSGPTGADASRLCRCNRARPELLAMTDASPSTARRLDNAVEFSANESVGEHC
jgi:hypothetical protein